MKTKSVTAKFSAGDGERAFVARITSDTLDRDSEVLLPDGMNAKGFLRTGTILYNHDSARPIGSVSKLAREGSAWVAKGILASRPAGHVGEWFPDTVLALIRQGVLRGVSVGFIERESRPPTRKDVEMFGDEVHRVVSKWDLLEFSVVSIPNNPDALIGEVSMKSARRPVRVTVEPSLRSRIKSEIARLRSRV